MNYATGGICLLESMQSSDVINYCTLNLGRGIATSKQAWVPQWMLYLACLWSVL